MGETVWQEHIFVEALGQSRKDAENAKIKITLQDKGFLKNTTIGMFQFDLSTIYNKKDHCIQNTWLALNNPDSDDYSKI